jgi:hypothetical protein
MFVSVLAASPFSKCEMVRRPTGASQDGDQIGPVDRIVGFDGHALAWDDRLWIGQPLDGKNLAT